MSQDGRKNRRSVEFRSQGTRCGSWLYWPEDTDISDDPPIVVMAHGFGATQEMGLPRVANRFTERGLAVLTFDFRSFGESDGTPRNVVDPFRHVEDWRAAISYARSIEGIDGDRIGVWGFSFSGGHALIAAEKEDVDAYVGQTPFLDGLRSLVSLVRKQGLGYARETTVVGVKDFVGKFIGKKPNYVPIVGEPGELAALTMPGIKADYESMVSSDSDGGFDDDWNRCAARVFLQFGRYRPVTSAGDLDCPALIIEGTEDRVVPEVAVRTVMDGLDDVTRVRYHTNHFGTLTGPLSEKITEREGDFLEQQLIERK